MAKKQVERTHLTPPVVAHMLGASTDTILNMIHSGELLAVNLGQATRPRWRIPKDGLELFLASRSNQQQPSKPGNSKSQTKPMKRYV